MFNFFKKQKKVANVTESSFEIELTASVLAYELARSDGSITQEELSILMSEIEKIAEKVGKEKEELFRIIKIYSKESVSFYEFVEDINQNYSKQEKLNLLKLMWKTAYTDKQLDVNEEKLIRRLANLINIKDMDVLKLKDLFRT